MAPKASEESMISIIWKKTGEYFLSFRPLVYREVQGWKPNGRL